MTDRPDSAARHRILTDFRDHALRRSGGGHRQDHRPGRPHRGARSGGGQHARSHRRGDLHREGGRRDEAAAAHARSSAPARMPLRRSGNDWSERCQNSSLPASAPFTPSAAICCASGPWKRGSIRCSRSRRKTKRRGLPIGPSRAGSRRRSPTRRRECGASSDGDRKARHRAKCCAARSAVLSSIAISPPPGDAILSTDRARSTRSWSS